MYERQFGLRENPFAAGHQSKYVYPSREHQEALAHLRFGIENREAFVLITGEVGTGKTTALYDALSEWKSRAVVALITNTALTRSELYEEICMRFGVPLAGTATKPQLIQQLERHLMVVRARGDFAILLIDEAQNLDSGLLEETRLLSNLEAQGQKLLQIFLVGQPELEDKLAQPELRQLRQRIAVHYRLRPLTVEDTERYIHHRITVAGGHALTLFPADACAEVHAATHGIPREINTVAAQALLNAFVEDAAGVRPEHVRAIVRDTGFHSVLDRPAAHPAAGGPANAAVTPAATPVPPAADPPVHVATPSVAPAPTREVRQVPAAAPTSARAASGATPSPIEAEGHPMAGVRPAGSTESWQSWMDSLAKLPVEPGAPREEAGSAAPPPSGDLPPAGDGDGGTGRDEMTPEEFYAVEEEALRTPIGDGDDSDEYGDYDENDIEAALPGSPEDSERADDEDGALDEEAWMSALDRAPAEAPGAGDLPAETDPRPGLQWSHAASPAEDPEPVRAESPAFASETPEAAETPSVATASHAVRAAQDEPTFASPLPVAPSEPVYAEPAPAAPAREPVAARVSAAPARPIPAAAGMPARLRERLEAAERAEASAGNKLTGWLIGVAAVAAVTIGVILALRFRSQSEAPTNPAGAPAAASAPATGGTNGAASPALPPRTAATPETPASPGVAAVTQAPSHTGTPGGAAPKSEGPASETAPTQRSAGQASAVASPPSAVKPASAASATPPPAPKPAATVKPAAPTGSSATTAAATPAVAKPAAPKASFGISVGSFLAEERAASELARLSASTGVKGRVMPTPDGDYRVVLGSYPDKNAAENAAGDLIGSGKVDEARVVSLGTAAKK